MYSHDDRLVRFLYFQARNHIAGAINDLPETERLVIALHYDEALSFPQIGFAIGEPYARVSELYASGLQNLRARLGDPVGKWQPTIHTSPRPPTNGWGSEQ